ncbi:sphingomyelin phosphodiesterase 5-like isoform X3 [Mustela erminea]|uniref:sphingomyelin phosphodiesterase 5-like isoform X3 n=1 Tax=Mustela erminea TaxID=36723 RepID=UPI001386D06C|nr:sphingomyelin phosphodiesterase 5-like isoform X3 [Mustela erminea]
MQSPPDWPPTPGTLRPSPFPHPALHALHRLARALLFPAYWALDQLLGCGAPLARANRRRALRAAAGAVGALLLLLLAGLPLALPGLLLWLPLQAWRRPFCYRPPPECWAPPAPWRPSAEPARCFGFLSANLCLLPDGLARFNNLRHSQRRAEAMGAVLLAGLRPSRYGTTGCSPPGPGTPGGSLIAAVPAGLDFVCLQEVFDLRAAHRLVRRLAPYLGPVLYDVGSFGLQPGPHLKLLGSGLLLASRYPLLRAAFRCFPHARREDALASKGLLSAQAQVGILDGRRIVGFLHCTHLHAPSGEPRGRVAVSPPSSWRRRVPALVFVSAPPTVCPRPEAPRAGWWSALLGSQVGAGRRPGWGAHPDSAFLPTPAGDAPLRCKQLTLLLDWIQQFEAQSRPGGDAVAFSVLLGDLNFDNCSLDHAKEQEHELFSHFRDPCRLGTRREQPWALGTMLNTSTLRHSVACSSEMLRRALEQEEGRHRYLAGPPGLGPRTKPWRGRRVDYVMYRGVAGGPLSPVSGRIQGAGPAGAGATPQPDSCPQEVEHVTFSTALAGLTDHLAVGLRLRVSVPS